GFDHVEGFQYRSANKSIAMNNGASRPPAVTGSITSDSNGLPTMENPPPNAPVMKQIRNTPAKAIRIVVAVNSIARLPTGCSRPLAGTRFRGGSPSISGILHPDV